MTLATRTDKDVVDFVDNGSLGLQWIGPDGTILWANQALLDLLGRTRDAYIGQHVSGFFADPSCAADIHARLCSNQPVRDYEAQLICQDGSIKHVIIDSSVHRDAQGNFVNSRCFIRDNSERKRLERELEANRCALELLVDTSRTIAEAGTDVGRMYEALTRQIADRLGDTCAIRLASDDGRSFTTVAVHAREPDGDVLLREMMNEAAVPENGLSVRALQSDQVVTLEGDAIKQLSAPALSARQRYLERYPLRSAMAAPLRGQGSRLGVLICDRHASSLPYSPGEQKLVADVAERVTLAILAARQHEQLSAERANLAQEKRRLDAVLRQIPAAVALIDARSRRVLLANERNDTLFRRPLACAEDFAELRAFNAFRDDTGKLDLEDWPLARSLSKGEIVTGEEIDVERGDGSLGTVRVSSAPVRNDSGEIVAGIALVDDVTEARRADHLLRASEGQLRALLDASPALVYLKDVSGRHLLVNRPFEELLGVPRAEILGKTDAELFPREVGERFRADDISVMIANQPRQFDESFVLGGGKRAFLTVKFPLHDASGRIVGVGGFSTDVSARKHNEAQREALIGELTRRVHFGAMFIGILSHDLRNPLGAISMTAESAMSSGNGDEKLERQMRRIVASAERMGRMIDQLLDLTRIRVGRGLPVDRAPVDLGQLCHTVVDEMAHRIGSAQVTVGVQGDASGLWDRDLLGQLLSNMLGNAVQHRVPDTPIQVSIDGRDGQAVVLEVNNRGCIPAERLPGLFEPFKRREAGDRSMGLGLGLYITQQIAAAHGGDVAVRSNDEQGTTFVLRLPRGLPEARPANPTVPPAPTSHAFPAPVRSRETPESRPG